MWLVTIAFIHACKWKSRQIMLTGLCTGATNCDVYAMAGVVVEVLCAKPIWKGVMHF